MARQLAIALDARRQDYALGGAIALGYWAAPRGTVDVDLTLFLPPDKPSACVWLLQDLGCKLTAAQALESLQQHGFCRVEFDGVRVDVFLPTIEFYAAARDRRRLVKLGEQPIQVWDAESLVVFKMMFFRRKDIADMWLRRLSGRGWTFALRTILTSIAPGRGAKDLHVEQENCCRSVSCQSALHRHGTGGGDL